MKYYHGTELGVAKDLVAGMVVKAKGTGELGGGLYVTADPNEAAHIADYYLGKEGKGKYWGVVEFDVPDDLESELRTSVKTVSDEKRNDYLKAIKERGNSVESKYSYTEALILDTKTPYKQILLAQEAIKVLNRSEVKRTLVNQGELGVDKDRYSHYAEPEFRMREWAPVFVKDSIDDSKSWQIDDTVRDIQKGLTLSNIFTNAKKAGIEILRLCKELGIEKPDIEQKKPLLEALIAIQKAFAEAQNQY